MEDLVELIIFDFFGVISSEIAPIWFRKYLNNDDTKIIKEEMMPSYDKGEKSSEELFYELSKISKQKPEEILREWLELAKINENVIDIIRKLKNKYKVAILSNAPQDFLENILEREDIRDLFDEIVISSQVNMIKPDENIYYELLRKVNITPNKTIMFDDNPKNIETANRIGIKGILVENENKFINELYALLEK